MNFLLWSLEVCSLGTAAFVGAEVKNGLAAGQKPRLASRVGLLLFPTGHRRLAAITGDDSP